MPVSLDMKRILAEVVPAPVYIRKRVVRIGGAYRLPFNRGNKANAQRVSFCCVLRSPTSCLSRSFLRRVSPLIFIDKGVYTL